MQYEEKQLLTVFGCNGECQPMLAFDSGLLKGKEAPDPCGHSSRIQTAASTANETRCKLKEGLTCLHMDMDDASINRRWDLPEKKVNEAPWRGMANSFKIGVLLKSTANGELL